MLIQVLAALLLTAGCSGQGRFGGAQTSNNACGLYRRCVSPSSCSLRLPNTGETYCNRGYVCCPNENLVQAVGSRKTPSRPQCGHRNQNGVRSMMETNITRPEANKSEFGEFPWILAILEKRLAQTFVQLRFHCGGSLIHRRVALTAAHYVNHQPADKFLVRAGEWDPHSTDELFPFQDRQVQKVVVHPRFKSTHLTFDAALLIVDSPFFISPHIQMICLPDADVVTVSSGCFVAGWGKISFESTMRPAKMKKIELAVHSKATCNKLLKPYLGLSYPMHSSQVCAGGEEDQDACTGDGGSPLMCPISGAEDHYFQVGIVSYGFGCGERDVPGVYSNVANFRSWIDGVLEENNLSQ